MNFFTNRIKWTLAALLGLGALGIAQQTCHAGAVGGPKFTRDRVSAEDTDVYHIAFRAREEARIEVRGDGDTVLRVRVYDEDGNLIATDSDGDGTGHAVVHWIPRWTGQFTIRVTNNGGVFNRYTLETN